MTDQREEHTDQTISGHDDPGRSDVEQGGADGEPAHEMGFFDHLEELRWRIIKALLALVLSAGFCSFFYKEITEDVLLRPAREAALKLINTEPMGQISLVIQVVMLSGLIVAVPFITWQFWGFVKPGLYAKERRYVSVIAIATIGCFLGGVAFAYFIMIPTSLGFLGGFELAGVQNTINVGSYLSFVLGFILACGGIFEMPMLSYALSRFGITTPAFLRRYRRHAGIVILIVSAIITPTPDPVNQLLLAVPLYGLYEISILVSASAQRQRDEAIGETTNQS